MVVTDSLGEKDLREEPYDDEHHAAGRDLVGHVLVPLEVVGVNRVAGSLGPLVEVVVLPEIKHQSFSGY